jgi:hypothetical protein
VSYGNFTLKDIKQQFHATIDEMHDLFAHVAPISVSDLLQTTLQYNVRLAIHINTEKARSELIIAPLLVELRKLTHDQIGLFSGTDFHVDASSGLIGVCDFIISRSTEQLFISAPVLMLVEAKNESIKGGLGQCAAQMIAAQRFNEQEGNAIPTIYGAVTTGTNWRFLRLHATTISIDQREYFIDPVEKLMGILFSIVQGDGDA